eukprot:9311670-Pyramimonas_sp.AAC.1
MHPTSRRQDHPAFIRQSPEEDRPDSKRNYKSVDIRDSEDRIKDGIIPSKHAQSLFRALKLARIYESQSEEIWSRSAPPRLRPLEVGNDGKPDNVRQWLFQEDEDERPPDRHSDPQHDAKCSAPTVGAAKRCVHRFRVLTLRNTAEREAYSGSLAWHSKHEDNPSARMASNTLLKVSSGCAV